MDYSTIYLGPNSPISAGYDPQVPIDQMIKISRIHKYKEVN